MAKWTKQDVQDVLQYISDSDEIKIWLVPADPEEEYKQLCISSIGLEDGDKSGTYQSIEIFAEMEATF
jgi:hypothetical protein